MKEQVDHSGHRARFRERVDNVGLKNLPKHEVLEFLLQFCLPRKDTNALAHKLLNEFGSLSAIMEADVARLSRIDGVGNRTAQFLTNLPTLFEIYKIERTTKPKVEIISGVAQAVKYFRTNYEIINFEKCVVLCMNSNYKLVRVVEYDGKNDNSVNFDLRAFAKQINDNNISGIIVMHTHPGGKPTPSDSDYNTTKEIVLMCHALRILMCDHIVLTESQEYSFAMTGLLDNIYKELNFSEEQEKINMLRQINPFDKNLH